jgi:hypothetical protein
MSLTSTHVLILSLACIAGGVVLLLFNKSEAMSSVLLLAGAGGFAKEIRATNARSRESRAKAEEALEATQTLRRDLLNKQD